MPKGAAQWLGRDSREILSKTGGIEFDMHRRNLKREAGCYMDNIMIADKFRAWCAVKGLALNAPNIEQSFSSFCAKVGRV